MQLIIVMTVISNVSLVQSLQLNFTNYVLLFSGPFHCHFESHGRLLRIRDLRESEKRRVQKIFFNLISGCF